MDENLHNIENLFRDGLEDNEELPSSNVWNGIDNTLDKDNVVSIKKKYTTMKRVAILLLLLLLGFSVYELSTRHNSERIAKGNGNDSNNEAINKSNEREGVVPSNISPKNPIDSISINNKDKSNSNSPVDNSISNKNTANNNPPIQPGNNIISENKNVANSNTNSSTQKNNANRNSSVDNTLNTIVENNIPENNTKPNNKLKTKNKQGINSNTVAENILPKKNKRKFIDKSAYSIKISSPLPTEDEQQTVANNEVDETNSQSNLLKRLSPVTLDKIKVQRDSVDAKKLLESLAVKKITLPLDTNNATAKNAKKKKAKVSRFSVAPFFSPDISWYRLQEDKPDNQPDNLAAIEKSEKHEFSSTTGILVDYKSDKHWSFQSGFTYSNTNITVEPKTIYAQSDNAGNVKYRINTSSGYGYVLPSFSSNPAIGDSLYAFTSTHTINYIGIPLAVKYNIAKGKFSFNIMAGFSTNILTRGKIETTLAKGFNNETEVVNNLQGLRKIYFSGLTGLGVDYKLNKKMSLSFVPTYRFALNSINQNAPVKSYPNSLGLLVGLKIGL